MANATQDQDRTARRNGSGPTHDLSRLGDVFLASLNHDIRTPLSGIVGMTDLLMETDLSEEQKEFVSTTKLCADQLLEMMGSALDYAALAAGGVKLQREEFHLPQVIESLVREFEPKAHAKKLSLTTTLSSGIPEYVLGDAVRLRQVLNPLLANAVKFTEAGAIEIAARTKGEVASGRVSLEVRVHDTGIGIAAEQLQVIYDSFRQLESGLSRSYPGMGLGLAVAKKLVEIMGGTIKAESNPGVGSEFIVTVPVDLPADQAADLARLAMAANEDNDDGRPSVLLVDDNDVARRIVTHILRRANYRIDCAVGGAEGIRAAGEYRYNLILMDLQMPNVNGLQATESIRKLPGYKATPILALSANYSEEFTRACKAAGMRAFLSKPIQREALLKAVAEHLR